MDAYISTNEAADRLGITRQRVLQLINSGRLPAEKFANVYMIKSADLKQVEDRPQGRPPGIKTAKDALLKGVKKGGKK
jgi:excisionase family DNA binding protein